MNAPGRPTPRVILQDHERRYFADISRSRQQPADLVRRVKIILGCDGGRSDLQVANELGISPHTVAKWRRRYLDHGLKGLEDQRRTPRQRSSTGQDIAKLIALTLSPPPDRSGRWTAAAIAAATGWSESTIRRKWRQHGIWPSRLVFQEVNPDFACYGIWSVVGVYRSSIHRAVAVAVDARLSEEVPPFLWTGQILRQSPSGSSGPPLQPEDGSAGLLGGAGGFERFLGTISYRKGVDRALFVVVDSPGLHQATLHHLRRFGRANIHVCHTNGAEAWQDAVHTLTVMLAHRHLSCGSHNDDYVVEKTLQVPVTDPIMWTGDDKAAREGGACRCRYNRGSHHEAYREYGELYREQGPCLECRCNRRDCVFCCHRRYVDLCERLTREWTDAFGPDNFPSLTLTYRASSALTPAEWLERAHRDLESLRARWRREWGAMPPHLWSLEFTVGGTPHFHIMIPRMGKESFERLKTWLPEAWVSITGVRRIPGTGHQHAVRISVRYSVRNAVYYLMKSVEDPTPNLPVPPGTPAYRRWARSQRWAIAHSPKQLATAR